MYRHCCQPMQGTLNASLRRQLGTRLYRILHSRECLERFQVQITALGWLFCLPAEYLKYRMMWVVATWLATIAVNILCFEALSDMNESSNTSAWRAMMRGFVSYRSVADLITRRCMPKMHSVWSSNFVCSFWVSCETFKSIALTMTYAIWPYLISWVPEATWLPLLILFNNFYQPSPFSTILWKLTSQFKTPPKKPWFSMWEISLLHLHNKNTSPISRTHDLDRLSGTHQQSTWNRALSQGL